MVLRQSQPRSKPVVTSLCVTGGKGAHCTKPASPLQVLSLPLKQDIPWL